MYWTRQLNTSKHKNQALRWKWWKVEVALEIFLGNQCRSGAAWPFNLWGNFPIGALAAVPSTAKAQELYKSWRNYLAQA